VADVIDEILALETFVRAAFPASTIEKQTVPEQPAHDTFVIRFLSETPTDETLYSFRLNREYQIVYFSDRPEQALPIMGALTSAIENVRYIAETRTRLDAFGYSQPALTDNDKYVTIGILRTSTRQARPQPKYDKINHVYQRFNINAEGRP
jgi:hypothetical protein